MQTMQDAPPRTTRFVMTPEKTAFFRENGYLVAENAYSPQEIAELKHDAAEICRGEHGQFRGLLPREPGQSDEDVFSPLSLHPLPPQNVAGDGADHESSSHGQRADANHRPQCEVHAINALHQSRGEAGAGLASG